MFDVLADSSSGASAGAAVFFLLLVFALFAFALIGYWKVFEKIGLPGWMGIVPFVNVYMLFKARGQREPVVWLILSVIPFVNIVALWFLSSDTAELFGKDLGWKLFLFFLPGVAHMVLGYGSAQADPTAISPAVRRDAYAG
ncbi:MAG: hypothetical protein KF906_05585 [Actinobacteria bacterium]|nr:hypothetical protein [Actinomycetota bacterium]